MEQLEFLKHGYKNGNFAILLFIGFKKMTAKKKQNYTDAQVTQLVLLFSACTDYQSIKDLAEELESLGTFPQKTVKMLIGKVSHLSRSGTVAVDTGNPELEFHIGKPLYTGKVYATKIGGDVIRKSTLVSTIASLLLEQGQIKQGSVMDSLESCTKPVLEILVSSLTPKITEQGKEVAE